MTTQLHQALEQLDVTIDRLETTVEGVLKHRPKGEPKSRAEALTKLDGIIGRLESLLRS